MIQTVIHHTKTMILTSIHAKPYLLRIEHVINVTMSLFITKENMAYGKQMALTVIHSKQSKHANHYIWNNHTDSVNMQKLHM